MEEWLILTTNASGVVINCQTPIVMIMALPTVLSAASGLSSIIDAACELARVSSLCSAPRNSGPLPRSAVAVQSKRAMNGRP